MRRKPVGQWNEGRIVCQGTVIQHWLNGTKVIDFDYTDPRWEFNVTMLKKRGGDLAARGAHLSLQDHGDPVWYRRIRLRKLSDSDDIGHSDVKPAEIPADVLKKEKEKTGWNRPATRSCEEEAELTRAVTAVVTICRSGKNGKTRDITTA